MVAFGVAVVGEGASHHLFVSDVFEVQKLVLVLVCTIVETLTRVRSLREETGLARDGGSIG